jgi:hypothetical protein
MIFVNVAFCVIRTRVVVVQVKEKDKIHENQTNTASVMVSILPSTFENQRLQCVDTSRKLLPS